MLKETKELCGVIDEIMDVLKGEFDFDTVCAMNGTDLKILQKYVKLIETAKNFYMAQGQALVAPRYDYSKLS